MGIQIIDPKEIALREKKRTVVMNTRKMHAWVHYYPNPGDHDELHCHNEDRSEEHTSELQSLRHLVCRLLLEKKKKSKGKHRREERRPLRHFDSRNSLNTYRRDLV